MKTTLRLDDALVRQVKTRAAAAGRSLAATVEDALRVYLARAEGPRTRGQLAPLPLCGGRGLRRGVRLESNARLLDVMEGGRAGA